MTKEELEEVVEHDRRIRAAINACLKALIDFPVEDKRAVVDELDQRVALEEQRAIVTTARQQLEAGCATSTRRTRRISPSARSTRRRRSCARSSRISMRA